MSGKAITRYLLTCDGCSAQLGENGEYENALEARADAYGKGWRFPGRVKMSGETSAYTSDVCPACLPTWTPEPNKIDTWKNRRSK